MAESLAAGFGASPEPSCARVSPKLSNKARKKATLQCARSLFPESWIFLALSCTLLCAPKLAVVFVLFLPHALCSASRIKLHLTRMVNFFKNNVGVTFCFAPQFGRVSASFSSGPPLSMGILCFLKCCAKLRKQGRIKGQGALKVHTNLFPVVPWIRM